MIRRSSALSLRSAALAAAISLAAAGPLYAQAAAQPATQAATPPATAAKWVPPVKGMATIEVIRGTPRRLGSEIVSTLQIKNTSKGAIALLGVEEIWYDNSTPRKIVSGDRQKVKKLINPGEVVEVTTKSPYQPGLALNQYVFSHANGKVDAKPVKKFSTP